jgi:hypothetical protein
MNWTDVWNSYFKVDNDHRSMQNECPIDKATPTPNQWVFTLPCVRDM